MIIFMKHYNIYIKTLAVFPSHIEKIFIRNTKQETPLTEYRLSLSKWPRTKGEIGKDIV